jgi:site-specific recombinase XerD
VLLYLARLAPASQLTLRYVLQDAADRLGFEDVNIENIPWHQLQPGDVSALVEALHADGYTAKTSSLYVHAIRGLVNEAWYQELVTHEQLLKIRALKPATSAPAGSGARPRLIAELMQVCIADSRPQGVRDAAVIGLLYGSAMRASESVNLMLDQVDAAARRLECTTHDGQPLTRYVPAWTFARLDDWLQLRRSQLEEGEEDDGFLFNRIVRGNRISRERITRLAIYYIARQRGEQVGVKIVPEDFRRAFVTRVAQGQGQSVAQRLADPSNG